MGVELALSLVTAGCVLALGTSLGTLWFLWTRDPTPSVAALERDMNALRLSLADLFDKVETWQRRDRVRRLRESNEPQPEEPLEPRALKQRLRETFG
jgi:hypothetical protein